MSGVVGVSIDEVAILVQVTDVHEVALRGRIGLGAVEGEERV